DPHPPGSGGAGRRDQFGGWRGAVRETALPTCQMAPLRGARAEGTMLNTTTPHARTPERQRMRRALLRTIGNRQGAGTPFLGSSALAAASDDAAVHSPLLACC